MSLNANKSLLIQSAPIIFVGLWSTGYVGAKFGLPFAEPLTLSAIRFSIVALILGLILLLRKAPLPRDPRMWGHLAVSGFLIHTCFIGGIFSAIHLGVDISIASLTAGAQPLLTALVVMPLLGERLTARQWVGFVLGFIGIVFVIVKSMQIDALSVAGLVGCLVGLGGITFGSLYQKRFVVGIDLLSGSFIQFAAALIPCALWAMVFESGVIVWNVTLIATLVWLCLGLSLGAISILLFLIREGAASKVSSLFYLVPPVTALQGYWLFDERLTIAQGVGIVLVVIGVALINVSGEVSKPARR